ncbi:hypothetical protein JCM9533A_60690 [Catenuloplanes niger JCM 9533]
MSSSGGVLGAGKIGGRMIDQEGRGEPVAGGRLGLGVPVGAAGVAGGRLGLGAALVGAGVVVGAQVPGTPAAGAVASAVAGAVLADGLGDPGVLVVGGDGVVPDAGSGTRLPPIQTAGPTPNATITPNRCHGRTATRASPVASSVLPRDVHPRPIRRDRHATNATIHHISDESGGGVNPPKAALTRDDAESDRHGRFFPPDRRAASPYPRNFLIFGILEG